MSEVSESEQEEISRIVENKSIQEIKQAIVDSLRNIEYDVMMNNFEEVKSKLSTAQKYYAAWMGKVWPKLLE